MVEIQISRSIGSIFLVTYLPTFLINTINQATNYFDSGEHFEAIVTVNLTCMMVLSSLYISVAESLPGTAYVKYVEIWLLANLIYPFIIVTLHTFIQANRPEESLEWDRSLRKKTRIIAKKKKQDIALAIGKYVVPVLAGIFIFVYWGIGLMKKYDGNYYQ